MSVLGRGGLRGWNARLLNALLIASALAFAAWTVRIWTAPQGPPASPVRDLARRGPVARAPRPAARVSYGVIAQRDVFSPTRGSAPGGAQGRAPARTALRTPKLTLLGTVILDSGRAAILAPQGREAEARFYTRGEVVEGYTVTAIGRDSVVLKRGGAVLKVPLTRTEKGSRWKGRPGVQPGGRRAQRRP